MGSYGDDAGILHAFVRSPSGEYSTIDPPDAVAAEAISINARRQIVGRYLNATPKLVSFFLERGEDFVALDVADRCDTVAYSINDRGQILITRAGSTDGTTCFQDATTSTMQ